MLAIIGGTGIYKIDGLEVLEEVAVDTPFGEPSAKVVKAKYKDKQVNIFRTGKLVIREFHGRDEAESFLEELLQQ